MVGQQALNPQNWTDKYADDLYGYALSKSSSTELAEDFVQETFLSALNGIKNFKGNSSERTWLFSILKNKIADHYRKASTRYEVSDNSFMQGDESRSFLDLFFDNGGEWTKQAKPKQWSADEGNILDDKDFQLAMQKCVGKLPANWHTAITLKFLEEKDSDDICKELNVSASNYWVIMHRAKLMLRTCLEKTWFKLQYKVIKKIFNVFIMACREATVLIEKKQERKLDVYEKLALRFHLVVCNGCRRYNEQSVFLNELIRKSSLMDITDFSKMRLADDAKIRIQQLVENKLNNM